RGESATGNGAAPSRRTQRDRSLAVSGDPVAGQVPGPGRGERRRSRGGRRGRTPPRTGHASGPGRGTGPRTRSRDIAGGAVATLGRPRGGRCQRAPYGGR